MVKLSQKLSQKQTLSPQQILQAKLLQLNNLTLEKAILHELEVNPVLDQEEPEKEKENEEPDFDLLKDDDEYERTISIHQKREYVDIPQPEIQDFIETVIKQLDDYDLSETDKAIAEEILWNVDERGYLGTELFLIADRFNRTEEEILPTLKLVQKLDPKGIASRDLQECLLMQLSEKKETLPYRIIEQYFELFTHKRFEVIEKALDVPKEELSQAISTISHLNPKPGEGIRFSKDEIIVPDLVVRKQNDKWVVLINDSGVPELKVSPDYTAMMEEQTRVDLNTRSFIKSKIETAQWFIEAIRQRKQTLTRVMYSIIKWQPEFFHGDIHNLIPMKLQDVADDIQMDISTISRSTRGKYADTPYGLYELKYFFTDKVILKDGSGVSNHVIKRLLKEIIDAEDKHSPLNDELLVQKLKEKSMPIARRTVSKYREQMNIPVARMRREM